MKLEIAAVSDIGRRDNNEDAFAAMAELGLFVVADGMGGYEGGEVASRLTVDTIVGFVERNARDADVTWPYAADTTLAPDENELAIAVRLADEQVAARRAGRLDKMGSTVACVRLRGTRCVVAHVGDSRVYGVRGGRVERLTRDHSMYEELIAAGSEVPAREDFPWPNVITRAIGMGTARADVRAIEVVPGDVLVVCTDGVWDPLPDDELAALCTRLPPGEACARLVGEALARGGKDNATVVVIRVAA
jgi:serine/threonine protein phosphatase PrpC